MSASSLERKIDLLLGLMQDLREEMRIGGACNSTQRRWISTGELGEMIGVTGRAVSNWIKDGRFPDRVVSKKQRGKGFIYQLDRVEALKVAEEIQLGKR